MKKIYIIFFIGILTVIYSCDSYLDVVPDNVATLDYAFRNKVGAEKFLATCYSYLPDFGNPANDPAIMGSDELWIHGENTWYSALSGYNAYNIKRGRQNVTNPLLNFWDGINNGRNLFVAIRDCNIFLENIQHVGKDLDETERTRWIAEVTFLKAYYHYYLLRMYGPIPLMRENLPVWSGIDEVRVFREPVDECVNYISDLIDEAVPALPLEINNIASELGRITQTAALAVKAELLVLAASPIFNGNSAYSGITDSRGKELFNSVFDANKWQRAMEACQLAIETAHSANHGLYEFTDSRYQLSAVTKKVMSLRNAFSDRWNKEILWAVSKNTASNLQLYSLPYFTMTDVQLSATQPIFSPTIGAAESFYSNHGVPIEEDITYDYENRYSTSVVKNQKYLVQENYETAILNQNREFRFYANLGFDGGIWFGNGRYKDLDMGTATETSWIVNAKVGQPSGKSSSIRYSITGYFAKKYAHFETATTSTGIATTRMAFPIMRLADLYLLYAEARNELMGPDNEVYEYLDMVRERAGLDDVRASWSNFSIYPDKPLNKEGLREIIQKERMNELAFEGKRFWDLRRWKIADQVLNQPVKGWNVEGASTIEYYNVLTFEILTFTSKEYLWPIREHSLRVNPNLIQNPFWNN